VFRDIQFPDGRMISTWITDSFSAASPNRRIRYPVYIGAGGVAGALIGGKSARPAGIIGGILVGFVIAANTGSTNLPELTLRPGKILRLQLGQDLTLD
jgi:hypothetical protein